MKSTKPIRRIRIGLGGSENGTTGHKLSFSMPLELVPGMKAKAAAEYENNISRYLTALIAKDLKWRMEWFYVAPEDDNASH